MTAEKWAVKLAGHLAELLVAAWVEMLAERLVGWMVAGTVGLSAAMTVVDLVVN